MSEHDRLRIDYVDHDGVDRLLDLVTYCLEGISLEFDRWEEEYVRGPGLYFAIVSGSTVADYADPMGDDRWPVDKCRYVFDDIDLFYQVAREVATSRDGAVVITVDGAIHGQMVRFRDLTDEELDRLDDVDEVEYAGWMGSRHMSAADTSARHEVVATVTLSEEDGRVTVFTDGTFADAERAELGGGWRVDT
ncbi:hypothetical protein ACFQJD_07015 [Haloplanus sp. GCM10025708]|uniref:hypothetical protein n=1 Tax=Haloplanus sp. GCM10025708 TaxID=3252679 RepID=UPI0036190A30